MGNLYTVDDPLELTQVAISGCDFPSDGIHLPHTHSLTEHTQGRHIRTSVFIVLIITSQWIIHWPILLTFGRGITEHTLHFGKLLTKYYDYNLLSPCDQDVISVFAKGQTIDWTSALHGSLITTDGLLLGNIPYNNTETTQQ